MIVDRDAMQGNELAGAGAESRVVLLDELRIETDIQRARLERFFAISVLEDQDPMQQPAVASQVRALETACREGLSILLNPSGGLVRGKRARDRGG